jgi:hypothetical protein
MAERVPLPNGYDFKCGNNDRHPHAACFYETPEMRERIRTEQEGRDILAALEYHKGKADWPRVDPTFSYRVIGDPTGQVFTMDQGPPRKEPLPKRMVPKQPQRIKELHKQISEHPRYHELSNSIKWVFEAGTSGYAHIRAENNQWCRRLWHHMYIDDFEGNMDDKEEAYERERQQEREEKRAQKEAAFLAMQEEKTPKPKTLSKSKQREKDSNMKFFKHEEFNMQLHNEKIQKADEKVAIAKVAIAKTKTLAYENGRG